MEGFTKFELPEACRFAAVSGTDKNARYAREVASSKGAFEKQKALDTIASRT